MSARRSRCRRHSDALHRALVRVNAMRPAWSLLGTMMHGRTRNALVRYGMIAKGQDGAWGLTDLGRGVLADGAA